MADGTGSRRTYRFGERRGAGLFGSLPATLLVPVGFGLMVGWLAVAGVLPWLLAGPVAVASVVVVFGRVRGRALHALLPALVRFGWMRLRGRHRWLRPVPLISVDGIPVAVPDALSGLSLFETDLAWLTPGRRVPIAVVHDRSAGTVSASLRVHGDGQYALLDDTEQEARADGWGAALGGFARERTEVVRVRWEDWAAPVPVQDQVGVLERSWADEAPSVARDSYLQLMRDVAPDVVRHEVIVTVTVAVGRGRAGRTRAGGSAVADTAGVLLDELRLFRDRLEQAAVQVLGVWSAAELITATRVRSDPAAAEQLAGLRQSLATATGVAAANFGPMTVTDELSLVRVDRAVHRTWWFARWPRREVSTSAWMSSLIDGVDCTRSVSVVFEPIRPSQSDRAVDRELVKREANIESRRRRDFRVTGKDTKAVHEAESREQELNAGFAELFYVGLVTLTAASDELLEAQASQLEQVAAQAGIELEPMWGQQAAGWVSSLPLGRSIARRMVAS